MRYVILDTETTGLNRTGHDIALGHRIIEIGCAEMVDGVVTNSHFHRYVNPHQQIDPKARAIHGISDAFLQDKEPFTSIVKDLLDFIGDSVIVMHNASFDTAFLDLEFRLLPTDLQPKQTFLVMDTLEIARSMFPSQNNTLKGLCDRLGYKTDGLHSALTDAITLAHVCVYFKARWPWLFS